MIDTIIQGDSLTEMRKMLSGSVDLIVTSPPYNCGIKYDSYSDDLRWCDYLSWCAEWIAECYRVLKDDGRIAINVLFEMGIDKNRKRVNPQVDFSVMMRDIGINLWGTCIWKDLHRTKLTSWGSWMSASSPYVYNPCEAIILGYKRQRKKMLSGESTISKEDFMMGTSGVWEIKPETNSLTAACFPVKLPKLVIELLTYKYAIVLDPFCGSGTTAVACVQTGRRFIGIEISEAYCVIARRRIAQAVQQMGIETKELSDGKELFDRFEGKETREDW